MPRPDRSMQGGFSQPAQHQTQQAPVGGMPVSSAGGVRDDIRALNSSILLITQKIKYLVRNEKILGRNLVVLNKKIRTLEEKILNSAQGPQENGSSSAEVVGLKQQIALLSAQLEDVMGRLASKEELKELKYVINSINPLEFATLSQVRDLIDKRMKEK